MSDGHVPPDVGWLLRELADPFVVFPLQSVARSLSRLLAESSDDFSSTFGPFASAARKYWSVEAEHYHDQTGLLLGASFVLGQALLTQTTSIVAGIKGHLSQLHAIPASRDEVLEVNAPRDTQSGLSKLVIVNTAANYFKHYHEWPVDWHSNSPDTKGTQRRTIQNALRLGMKPGDFTDNLRRAMYGITADGENVSEIGTLIQRWRENLVERLCKDLDIPIESIF